MRNNRHLFKKVPMDLPLYIANIRKVRLDKNYCTTRKDSNQKTYKVYWGKGLPVYCYDLRATSGRTISAGEFIRAKNIHDVPRRVMEYWTTVQGVKLI